MSAPGRSQLKSFRDAYLETWPGASRLLTEPELDLAVARAAWPAAAWRRALGSPEAGQELHDADAVAHWMLRLAQALG